MDLETLPCTNRGDLRPNERQIFKDNKPGRAATCALSTIGSGDFDPDDPKLVSISAGHHSGGTKPVTKTGNTAWAFSTLGTVSELL